MKTSLISDEPYRVEVHPISDSPLWSVNLYYGVIMAMHTKVTGREEAIATAEKWYASNHCLPQVRTVAIQKQTIEPAQVVRELGIPCAMSTWDIVSVKGHLRPRLLIVILAICDQGLAAIIADSQLRFLDICPDVVPNEAQLSYNLYYLDSSLLKGSGAHIIENEAAPEKKRRDDGR